MSMAHGLSTVEELVYERRTSHVDGMRRAGVAVREGANGSYCLIGPARAPRRVTLHVRDIRCGDAFLVLAARHPSSLRLVDPEQHMRRGHPEIQSFLQAFEIDLDEGDHA